MPPSKQAKSDIYASLLAVVIYKEDGKKCVRQAFFLYKQDII